MSKSNSLQRAVRHALLTGAVATVATSFPAIAAEEHISEVVVTGTRIANRDASAETPIFTVGVEEITESGLTTVDHYLNTLPQVTPNLSSQSNNPSSNGRAFIDLRGLGINRNLVLIDGRRVTAIDFERCDYPEQLRRLILKFGPGRVSDLRLQEVTR